MAVAAEAPAVSPSLDEVRLLAREHNLIPLRHSFIDDCETPVSAFLKLREDGPAFLLESADPGQRVGRYSVIGGRPRGGGPPPGRRLPPSPPSPAAGSAFSATPSSAPSSHSRMPIRTPSACPI